MYNFIINKLKTNQNTMKFAAISMLIALASAEVKEATTERPYKHDVEANGAVYGFAKDGEDCVDGSNCVKGLACGEVILTGKTVSSLICMNKLTCIGGKDNDVKANLIGELLGKKTAAGCKSWALNSVNKDGLCNSKEDCIALTGDAMLSCRTDTIPFINIALPSACKPASTCGTKVDGRSTFCTSAIKATASIAAALVAVVITAM